MQLALLLYEAFALLVFAFLMALDLSNFRTSRKAKNAEYPSFDPKALVIVPCKGEDLTLRENLISIKSQDYKNYNAVAVIDSKDDKALDSIKSAGISFILSNSLCSNCSGKVRAIATAIEKFPDYGVYIIADSDISVDKEWLSRIASPLQDKGVGISTMFPYFNPVSGFWSKVKLVWGFVGESLMRSERTRFGWGGSLAFRRSLIEDSMDLFKNSDFSVSDDITLTKLCRKKGLSIAYTKESQPRVNCKESLESLREWSNRQTALSVLGYKKNLYMGLIFYSAEIVTLLSSVILSITISPLFLILLLHFGFSLIKTYKRASRLDPEIALITALMPFLYLSNLIIANRMESITWRGREYKLKGQVGLEKNAGSSEI